MSGKTLITLNKSWVCEHLRDVTDIETKTTAWVLVQEPGFIGFGVVRSDKIWWPPYKPSGWEPDWDRVTDLRLFGGKGEWHIWRDWDGNHYARLLKSDEMTDAMTEHHFLWGTKKVDIDNGPWIKVVEDRGAEIWLPLASEELNEKSDLPLRLKLKQIVKYDPKTHLAGITDAALIGLVRSSNEDEIVPPVSLSCS